MSQTQFISPALRRERESPAWRAIAFYVIAAAGIALFVIPTFIIRPFRQQTPRALWLALALRQRAPLLTLIAAAVCILLVAVMWRLAGGWRKVILGIALLLVVASAVMSRLNYFEWMFHPIGGAQFEAQSSSKLDAKEMVMAVSLNGDARAYPISQMAYHHVLNDTVAGVPIAVTY
jgi:hypothetical protein